MFTTQHMKFYKHKKYAAKRRQQSYDVPCVADNLDNAFLFSRQTAQQLQVLSRNFKMRFQQSIVKVLAKSLKLSQVPASCVCLNTDSTPSLYFRKSKVPLSREECLKRQFQLLLFLKVKETYSSLRLDLTISSEKKVDKLNYYMQLKLPLLFYSNEKYATRQADLQYGGFASTELFSGEFSEHFDIQAIMIGILEKCYRE